MDGAIFLVKDDGQLVEMSESPYESEDFLQGLLARYPSLLAGSQINPDAPRRWLLISREAGVPSSESGTDRWAVDHLFLDQEGVPTLVEVKRSSDTRIRREVVGQMLDYAANAVRYWPVEQIQARFEAHCRERKKDPDQELAKFLEGSDGDIWEKCKTNLRAGKIRMLFVADEIPQELQCIIEFLNEQMDPAEVLGVEVRQFTGQGLRTLVPRLVGQTSEALAAKGRKPSRQWDEESFLEDLKRRVPATEVEATLKLLEWAKAKASWLKWGRGATYGTCYPMLESSGGSIQLFCIYAPSDSVRIQIPLEQLRLEPESERLEFLARLNTIPGISLPVDDPSQWPVLPLSSLTEEGAMKRFQDAYESVIEHTAGCASE